MKTKAIFKSLRNALDKKKDKKKKDALESVLKKLKRKEAKLKAKVEDAKGGKEKKALVAKLKVNQAHRKKGEKVLGKI